MEKNINIPKGWKTTEQGTICKLGNGEKLQGKEMPYLEVKYLRGQKEKTLVSEGRFIQKGSKVILVDGENSGEVFVIPEDGYMGSTFKTLEISSEIDEKYLLYFIASKKSFYRNNKVGSAIPHLDKKKFAQMPFAYPSLTEQSAIVSRIESQLSRLDSGIAALQKVQKQLAVYRQAVLKVAFEGCGENVKLGEIATMIDPQPSHRTPAEFLNGIPYVGIGDIDYVEKTIRFNTARKVAPELLIEHKERYTINKGDFVMGKIGTIGKPFLLPLPQNYALSANVILIQPFASKINPFFLYYQFQSPLITKQLNEGATATSQPAFGITKARLLNIKICSLTEQTRIVEQIESRLSVCDSIEKTVTESLRQAEVLRQSILKEAFEGKWGK